MYYVCVGETERELMCKQIGLNTQSFNLHYFAYFRYVNYYSFFDMVTKEKV